MRKRCYCRCALVSFACWSGIVCCTREKSSESSLDPVFNRGAGSSLVRSVLFGQRKNEKSETSTCPKSRFLELISRLIRFFERRASFPQQVYFYAIQLRWRQKRKKIIPSTKESFWYIREKLTNQPTPSPRAVRSVGVGSRWTVWRKNRAEQNEPKRSNLFSDRSFPSKYYHVTYTCPHISDLTYPEHHHASYQCF